MALGQTKTGNHWAFVNGYASRVLVAQKTFSDKDDADRTVWNDWFFGTAAPAGGFKPYFANQLSGFIGAGIT